LDLVIEFMQISGMRIECPRVGDPTEHDGIVEETEAQGIQEHKTKPKLYNADSNNNMFVCSSTHVLAPMNN